MRAFLKRRGWDQLLCKMRSHEKALQDILSSNFVFLTIASPKMMRKYENLMRKYKKAKKAKLSLIIDISLF